MQSSDLAELGALEALKLFRSNELRPTELLNENLRRIDQHNGKINALADRLEDASDAARAADNRYASGEIEEALGVGTTALLGLPIALKEKHAVAGRPLSQGLVEDKDLIAKADHPVTERIRAAGGIVHIRTTSPEYSCATVTHSPLWGVTRNPYNLELSPGGSSGGASAALAAGFTPLATASDIAGSVRVPAAFTGAVGYKAPYGRIPGQPPLSADWYRGDSPMGRSVADTALLTNAMVGLSSRDHGTLPTSGSLPIDYSDAVDRLAGTKIALSVTLGNFPVHPEIAAATRALARLLEAHGAVVEEVELPWTTDSIRETYLAHFGQLLAPAMDEVMHGMPQSAQYTERFIADSLAAAATTKLHTTLGRESQMQAELAAAMAGYDVLLAPVNAMLGLAADGNYLNGIDMQREDGSTVHLKHYWEGHMTVPFNICNRCPALAVPAGVASNGLPIGVQFVGHPFQDLDVFQVGAAVEALQPWNKIAPLA
jgi:aspartyl-tRNA(Asn)/glutamyl-tRNA(Gln) amidotransferase subunit A